MTENELYLTVRLKALERLLDVLLYHKFGDEKPDYPSLWYTRYLRYDYERGYLYQLSETTDPRSPEGERIEHRRFQLQILMNIAYLQGHLEDYNIIRKVSRRDQMAASKILESYDGYDESLLQAIDDFYDNAS